MLNFIIIRQLYKIEQIIRTKLRNKHIAVFIEAILIPYYIYMFFSLFFSFHVTMMKNLLIPWNCFASIHKILKIPVQLKMVWLMYIIPLECGFQLFCSNTFDGISIQRPLHRVHLTI